MLLLSAARISLPGLMRRRLSFHQQRHELDSGQYRLDEHLCLCLLPSSGTNLFAGTMYGGVFLSTNNGTSWTAVNTGLTNTNVNALAVAGTNLFAGTYGGGVFLSTNNGTSWTSQFRLDERLCLVLLLSRGTNLFAGTYGGGIFLSTNNGTSWTAVEYRLDEYLMFFSCCLRHESLCRD